MLDSAVRPHRTRWRELATSSPLALLVDLDGTMIEFAPTPQEAVLEEAARGVLARLIATGAQVVVVSGRTSESIDGMRHLVPGAWWVAEHGSWRWDPDCSHKPASSAPELDALAARLQPAIDVPGMLVERKSLSLCIHWRCVDAEHRDAVINMIEIACDEWLEEHPTFERLDGVEVVEIRQRSVTKGHAVNWVRERIPGVRIIAIGDDVTDADMFAELDDADASVSVGSRIVDADARVSGVSEAHRFLQWIADARSGVDSAPPITPVVAPRLRKGHRLLVMSNRTPGSTQGRMREVGGLVSALEPALRDEHGIWLGWSGHERSGAPRLNVDTSEHLSRARFDLPASMRQQFYVGFCNSVLWPLLHGFPARVRYRDGDYEAYVRANERYARHAVELVERDATIWVHDYHLLLAARELRALGHQGRIGLFLHVPFPTLDNLATVPWGPEIVDAMLDFDLVGFQTQRFAANFLSAAHASRSARRRDVEVGVFPATIDPQPFRSPSEEIREVASLRAALGDRKLIVGVDRLDYSKGIPERLDAYERLLEHHPQWQRRIVLLQISVPTRAEIPEYAELRERVERTVGRINGRFGDTDWVPVRYLYRSYDHHVLAQLYRLADVALVTPLRDGMNLVAKEFVASQDPASPGVLVLSQYAGAAETLASAVITNPFHPEGLAADIAFALDMPRTERVQRHRMLLAALDREGDAKAWAGRFLARLAARRSPSVGS